MRDGPRISVVGTCGSGKTTVAGRVAQLLGVPHIELDALRHGPGWVETPDPIFREQVAALTAQPAWVIDGNYRVVRDLIWDRATAIVWVDPERWVVMVQVLWRSLSRAVTGQELWNGNRERVRAWLDPDHPIRWAWRTHARRQREYAAAQGHDPRWVRLCTRSQVAAWLGGLQQALGQP